MKQLTFLDDVPMVAHYALARTTDPVTSHEAAEKVNVAPSWRTVARCLNQLGSASSNEIFALAQRLNLPISDSRVRGALRQKELLGPGYVRIISDEGRSKYGNDAQVYALTDKGRQQLLD